MNHSRFQKYSTIFEFGCGIAGLAGGSIVAGGYLADNFDVPRYATYLSSAIGAIAGSVIGLYVGQYIYKGLEEVIFWHDKTKSELKNKK